MNNWTVVFFQPKEKAYFLSGVQISRNQANKLFDAWESNPPTCELVAIPMRCAVAAKLEGETKGQFSVYLFRGGLSKEVDGLSRSEAELRQRIFNECNEDCKLIICPSFSS